MVRVVTDRPNIVRPLYFCGNKFAVLRKVAYKQALGAYGEGRVIQELGLRGWCVEDANAIRRNQPGYDLIARRPGSKLDFRISVKTRGITSRGLPADHFQIGGFKPYELIDPLALGPRHFTILVSKISDNPRDNTFYIVPTHVVRQECADRRIALFKRPKKKVDMGSYQLHLAPRPDGEAMAGHDIARRWSRYFENWDGIVDRLVC